MNKKAIIFGVMVAGALAAVGKRTYEIAKLKQAEKEPEVIEIKPEEATK